MAWLTGWNYRKSHVISQSAGAGTNYQKRIVTDYGAGSDSGEDVYLNGHCKTDFGDIRFTQSDGSTEIDYWLQQKTDSDTATFWVEVPDDLGTGNATIYIYYGNSTATYTDTYTDLQHGENTFIFFDNFDDASLDAAKWDTIVGAPSESGGYLVLTADEVRSDDFFASGKKLISRVKMDDWSDNYGQVSLFTAAGAGEHEGYQALDAGFRSLSRGASGSNNVYETEPSGGSFAVLEVKWATTNVLWYIDDNLERDYSDTDYIATANLQVRLESFNDSGYPTVTVDWLCIASFIASEPAHSTWGNEESTNIYTLHDEMNY